MARQQIPADIQNAILLKSRRRRCLCFWLNGQDEVQKGQIAHLDKNPANNVEGNLVFLCLEHHNEYDSTTSVAKGLREGEVRHWRDELYHEMEYRFRTIKSHNFELSIVRFSWLRSRDEFKACFRLKNTGGSTVRSPTVAIRLPEHVKGELPKERETIKIGDAKFTMPVVDIWKAYEKISDLFEPDGRVVIQELGGVNPILMPGHSFDFEALVFNLTSHPEGSIIELEYRVDAEGTGSVRATHRLQRVLRRTGDGQFPRLWFRRRAAETLDTGSTE